MTLMAKKNWYRLDNAGKLYPSIASTRRSTVFRLSAKLDHEVDPDILQEALDTTIDRFPYYKVTLKKGMFWYYFEEASHKPLVQPETYYPCMFLKFKKKKTFPFRVLYYKSYVHFEISHSIADGSAAMVFLKTLLSQYFSCKDGISCSDLKGGMDVKSLPDIEESEDAFRRYYVKGNPVPEHQKKAKHFPFELMEKGKYYFLTGIGPTDVIKDLAKKIRLYSDPFYLSHLFYGHTRLC